VVRRVHEIAIASLFTLFYLRGSSVVSIYFGSGLRIARTSAQIGLL